MDTKSSPGSGGGLSFNLVQPGMGTVGEELVQALCSEEGQ